MGPARASDRVSRRQLCHQTNHGGGAGGLGTCPWSPAVTSGPVFLFHAPVVRSWTPSLGAAASVSLRLRALQNRFAGAGHRPLLPPAGGAAGGRADNRLFVPPGRRPSVNGEAERKQWFSGWVPGSPGVPKTLSSLAAASSCSHVGFHSLAWACWSFPEAATLLAADMRPLGPSGREESERAGQQGRAALRTSRRDDTQEAPEPG